MQCEDTKHKLAYIEDNVKLMAEGMRDIPKLAASIHELALSVTSLKSEIVSDRNLNNVEIRALREDTIEIKENIKDLYDKVSQNTKAIDTAKGAASMAHILWGVSWTIGCAGVGAVVWIVGG